ncbi:hypothetical protein L6452_19227 [Arctium lappa]|uniref:Uncharacterized protein n=1 Tax=Arctium lappa TaxID=4217 RepID=A0ACB9BCF4_ARCLA|nr:hypothetical protein L6452_19227 [Arctium lappa]
MLSLDSSNHRLTTLVNALQAASNARDEEVRRLQAASESHQALTAQILESLKSLHLKVDTILVAPPTAAEGRNRGFQSLLTAATDSTEGELSRQGGDKGTTKLSPDEEAFLSHQQKSAALKAFMSEADRLKIQPPNKVTSDFGLSKAKLDSHDIFWYRKTLMGRKLKSKIVEIKLGTTKGSDTEVRMVIIREDKTRQYIKFSDLENYGPSEWYEISEILSKSFSRHRVLAKKAINGLPEKMKDFARDYKHSPEEEAQVQYLKKMCISSSPQISSSIKQNLFKDMAAKGLIPDMKNLNLKTPGGPGLTSFSSIGTVMSRPTRGVYFFDEKETLMFFRHEEISIADTKFQVSILSLIPISFEPSLIRSDIIVELHKRGKNE